jgi:hypothetical protein
MIWRLNKLDRQGLIIEICWNCHNFVIYIHIWFILRPKKHIWHNRHGASVAEWLRSLTSNHLPLTKELNKIWILDSLMGGSYPASLRNVGGSTQVPVRAWNNARKGTWGLPPPVKLERRDMTYTVSMRRKTQNKQTNKHNRHNV